MAATVDEQIQVHVAFHCMLSTVPSYCGRVFADQHRTIPGGGGTSMPDVSWCRRQAVGRPALCLEAVGAEGSGTIGFLREALKGQPFQGVDVFGNFEPP